MLIISQIGTLLKGPYDPTQPLIFHRFAAPLTPSRTYSESEKMEVFPQGCIWSARSAAISPAALLVASYQSPYMTKGTLPGHCKPLNP